MVHILCVHPLILLAPQGGRNVRTFAPSANERFSPCGPPLLCSRPAGGGGAGAGAMAVGGELKPLLAPQLPTRANALATIGRLCERFGTAAVVAVAAIDPGNLEIDVQAGAVAGYALVWAVVYASFAGWALQNASAQLALATGRPLAALCALEYADAPLVRNALWATAQLSVVSYDVAQVLGIALATQMLVHMPLWGGCLLAALDTALILILQARGGLGAVERAVTALLLVLAVALCYELTLSRPHVADVAAGALLPSLGPKPRQGALLAVAFLGSLVQSPNLFLHSWLVANRQEDADAGAGTDGENERDVHKLRREASVETGVVFLAAILVNAALLAISSAAFFPHVNKPVGLREASALLQSSLGSQFAATAWAVALLCSGHAATVTSALSAQTVATGFWRRDDVGAPSALGVRAVALVPAIIVSVRAGAHGADSLIVVSQVILAFALPCASIPMIRFLGAALHAQGKGGLWSVRLAQGAFFIVALANVAGTCSALMQGGAVKLGVSSSAFLAVLCLTYGYVLGVILCRPLRIQLLVDRTPTPSYSSVP